MPQDGVGGRTPMPRNDRPASVVITSGTSIDARINSGPITLGSTWTPRMRGVPAPMARSATMNSLFFIACVWVRTIRA